MEKSSESKLTMVGDIVEGKEAASMPRALEAVTRMITTDFSPSAPTITEGCSRLLQDLGGSGKVDSRFPDATPWPAFSLATALPRLFLGKEFGEYILEVSKGDPEAVLANFSQEERYVVASSARFASGHCIIDYQKLIRINGLRNMLIILWDVI